MLLIYCKVCFSGLRMVIRFGLVFNIRVSFWVCWVSFIFLEILVRFNSALLGWLVGSVSGMVEMLIYCICVFEVSNWSFFWSGVFVDSDWFRLVRNLWWLFVSIIVFYLLFIVSSICWLVIVVYWLLNFSVCPFVESWVMVVGVVSIRWFRICLVDGLLGREVLGYSVMCGWGDSNFYVFWCRFLKLVCLLVLLCLYF